MRDMPDKRNTVGFKKMKQLFFILILICTLLIVSCSYGRNHPVKPKSEWNKDHTACEEMVRKAIRESPTGYDAPANEIKLTRECMKRKGWR